MNTILRILTFCFLLSCSETATRVVNASPDVSDSLREVEKNNDYSHLSAEEYASAIAEGRIELNTLENPQTFSWLDSLGSKDSLVRSDAFKVYSALTTFGDGAIGELVCGHIKTYFQEFPVEFILYYNNSNDSLKTKIVNDVAFEFYASGIDYEGDWDAYLKAIKTKRADINLDGNSDFNIFCSKVKETVDLMVKED